MARALKVYGWQGFREGLTNYTSREIVLAASKAEVARVTGQRDNRLFNLCETGNAEEVAAATEAGQGVILWRGIDDRNVSFNRDDRRGGA